MQEKLKSSNYNSLGVNNLKKLSDHIICKKISLDVVNIQFFFQNKITWRVNVLEGK